MSDSSSSDLSSDTGSEMEEEQLSLQYYKMGSLPYQFEPMRKEPSGSAAKVEAPQVHPHANRINSKDWCQCGMCQPETDPKISFCCRECPQLDTVRLEEHQCCTENPGLVTVATNGYVLKAAYNSNKRHYSSSNYRLSQWSENEKYRCVANGNVVALAWGYLGRGNRVPLPSCVMRMIAAAFPTAHDKEDKASE